MKLSVLDQSVAQHRENGSQALQETIEMAKWCEALGYERFWISEHHAFPTIAGSAPEVLLAALGAATETIRLGSGGIMLPHYSAYKVAEVFSILENLYPNRIDLGIGRAPGTDMQTARALATDGKPKFSAFSSLAVQLSEYLWQEITMPMVSPKPSGKLPIWMLGSSPDSAHLAAQRGLPYNLAGFINPQVHPSFMQHYRENFKASELWGSPYAMLTVSVFCADTEKHAKQLQHTFDVNFYRFVTGQSNGVSLSLEEAQLYPKTPQLLDFIRQRDSLRATGTPDQVKTKLLYLAKEFELDELMLVTNMYTLEDRKRSFQLVKDIMDV